MNKILNTIISLQSVEEIAPSLQPFGPMKPLAQAIAHNPQLKGLSEPVSAGLFVVDVIIIFMLVLAIFGIAWVLLRYNFTGMKKHDETTDIKVEEAKRKKKRDDGIKAFVGIMAVFFTIPFLISVVCMIIQ